MPVICKKIFGQSSTVIAGGGLRHFRSGNRRDVQSMAERKARPQNIDGQFYVDDKCIDCDTCRWMAGSTFSRLDGQSAVSNQPQTRPDRIDALRALLACPTFSIHVRDKDPGELKEARESFPTPVKGCPGVFHCGYHSEKSYGGASYLIQRDTGNILFDSPRYNPVLAKQLKKLGGVQIIVLSHIDDVADHDKWAKHFGVPRIMHKTEIFPGIDDIEIQLTGEGPWDLNGAKIGEQELDGDVQIVHVPGHTSGCIALWHKPTKTIFSGDHLAYSASVGGPSILEFYNRQGVELQLKSVKKLLKYDFLNVLPGHGRILRVKDEAERLEMVDRLFEYYARVPSM